MRKIIETYQRNIKEIETDLRENRKDNDDSQKYEILYQKEKEIADFMTKFEEEKTTYEQQIKDHQEMIAGLLEHMQKNLARQHKLPSQMQVDEMKKDLNFKQKQLENAESTAAKLSVEVEQRQNDLEKIKNLEGRIDKEMQQVTDGVSKMEDEMQNKFAKTDDLKVEFEREKVRMATIKQLMQQYKNGLSKQITYHSMKHDTKKNQIAQSDIYNRLNDIEKKLI